MAGLLASGSSVGSGLPILNDEESGAMKGVGVIRHSGATAAD